MVSFTDIAEEARIAALSLADYASDMVDPTVRLGVTGLSRAGKTVFITSLVHNLTKGGRLPLFSAQASGRIASATLSPQPDDAVPRFEYETHLSALTGGGKPGSPAKWQRTIRPSTTRSAGASDAHFSRA